MALPSLWPGAGAVLVQRAKPVPNFHGRALLSQGLRASCAHLSRVCLWIMSDMYLSGVPCLCVWGQTARFADSLSMSVHHRMSTSPVCGCASLPRMRKRRVLTWGPGMQTDPGWHGTCLSVLAGTCYAVEAVPTLGMAGYRGWRLSHGALPPDSGAGAPPPTQSRGANKTTCCAPSMMR